MAIALTNPSGELVFVEEVKIDTIVPGGYGKRFRAHSIILVGLSIGRKIKVSGARRIESLGVIMVYHSPPLAWEHAGNLKGNMFGRE